MRLLIDEMHHVAVAGALRADGFDAISVAERPDLRGTSDSDLFELAASTHGVIVTENIRDFAPLAARWVAEGRLFVGLVLTSPQRFNRAAVAYPGDLLAGLGSWLTAAPPAGEGWTWWF